MNRVASFLEMLGGARPWPPAFQRYRVLSLALGAFWAFLLLLVLAFAGRGTKFVYIDF